MKKVMRSLFFLLLAGMMLTFMGTVGSDAKVIKPPVLKRGYSTVVYRINQKEKKQRGIVTLKTIKAKSSNKSVVSVKVRKQKDAKGKYYYVEVTGKKWGNAKITVRVKKKMPSGKMKTVITKIKVNVSSNKQRAKEAFELQNRTRESAGQKKLEWSEELYKLATVRVQKDGFDRHANFFERWDAHFSMYGILLDIEPGSENLYRGSGNPSHAIKGWRNSPGHYKNMIKGDWQCGAMAYDDKTDTWVAVFSEKPLFVMEHWRTETPLLRVRRIDNTTGEEICGSLISIVDDVGNEVYSTDVKEEKSNDYYIFKAGIFIVGKTYTVKEVRKPNGYERASNVTFVAHGASEGITEIVFSSDKR